MSTKNKFYVGIKNEVSTGTLELYFTDYIYDGWDWNTYETINMVQDTIDKIKAANPSKIVLIINSLGGDVMIGLAIYNYLKSSGITVETDVIGFAGSIASVMAMAGNPVRMARNSFMIIHQASTGVYGNATEMRKQADTLEKVSNELADVYAQKSGKHAAAHFTSMWADGGDVWLSATEAKELGLVDEITGEVSVNASVDFGAYGFKNIPSALLHAGAGDPAQKSITSLIQEGFMKIKDSLLAAIKGAKEDKKSDTVSSKQEVLDLVNSVLTPFAEAVDHALEELKPAEPAATEPAPAEPADTEPAPAEPADTEPAPAEPAATEPVVNEESEIKKLQNQVEALTQSIANMATRPASSKSTGSGDDLVNKVGVEYEK